MYYDLFCFPSPLPFWFLHSFNHLCESLPWFSPPFLFKWPVMNYWTHLCLCLSCVPSIHIPSTSPSWVDVSQEAALLLLAQDWCRALFPWLAHLGRFEGSYSFFQLQRNFCLCEGCRFQLSTILSQCPSRHKIKARFWPLRTLLWD